MALLAGIASSFAIEEVYYDEELSAVSPNGEWVAGAIDDGSVIIRNLTDNSYKTYISNGNDRNYYVGSGATPISNTGVVVGSTNGNNAAYWENGTWFDLPTPNPEFMSNAMSVTPDGSLICGAVGMDQLSVDAANIMLVPAVWKRKADGKYSDPVLLPHPEVDFTGRLPQYITAVSVSADGNTIAGQLRDYVGWVEEPIVYSCNAAGEWSYKMLYPQLINPTGKEFPEYPGDYDGIPQPTQESFMTEAELEAYLEAMEEYNGVGEMPQYEDYMTSQEIADYIEAYNEWVDVYNEWAIRYNSYMDLYFDCIEMGYIFIYNNVALTPDGQYYASTRELTYVDDPLDGPRVRRYPVVMKVDGSGYTDLNGNNGLSLLMSSMAQDATVLANFTDPENILPREAYIFPSNSVTGVPLFDYMEEKNPEVAAWMEENMLQDVADGITSSGQYTYGTYICSGIPVCTPDLSTIICHTTTDGWVYAECYYISFLFNTGFTVDAGVENAMGEENVISVLPGGVIAVKGNFLSIEIFDLAGAKAFETNNPAPQFATGLDHGIYIICATASDGSVKTLKTVI